MKLGKLFRRKRKDNRDDSKKDSSQRGTVEDEQPPHPGSSELADRGSSEFPSHALNTTTELPSSSRPSGFSTSDPDRNGVSTKKQPVPPSTSMNDEIQSESEDVVSEMAEISTKRRINKGVPDNFKGLTVSHRFNVPQVAEDPGAVREISEAYDAIPEIEQIRLPRGGISVDTKAVGRVQVCFNMCIRFNRLAGVANISIQSLESHPRPSRIACGLGFLFHRFILYQLRDFVERWALHLVLTLQSLNFRDISTFLFTKRSAH